MRLLGLLIVLLALVGCGGDEYAELDPRNPSRAAEGLVFTRADGSSYKINDAVAKCIEHRKLPGVKVVRLIAPADPRQYLGASDAREPALIVDVALGVQGTRKLPLQERDHDTGPSDLVVFGVDPEPRLSVAVDATLGSEVGQPEVQVEGGLASMLPG